MLASPLSLMAFVLTWQPASRKEISVSTKKRLIFVGSETRYPSLTLKVKKENNQTSFTRTGVQVPSIDVTQLYRKLFLEDSPEAKQQERLRIKRHTSILDTILDRAAVVNTTLSGQDQRKFAEYLNSIRSLEKKIEQQGPWLEKVKPSTEMKGATSCQADRRRNENHDGIDRTSD